MHDTQPRHISRIAVPVFSVIFLLAMPLQASTNRPPVSAICVEADDGQVIFEQNADLKRPPASMLKLMLMLLVTEGVDRGDFQMDQSVTATEKAQRMGGTQVYLDKGATWPLGHLMRAVAVASANDAAMAVAEGLWASEEACLKAMNNRARELGMIDTVFHSVNGLPPDKGEEFDVTTARDMALLARECVKHTRVLSWTRMKEFRFERGKALHYNTNKMLWRMEDCDGLKTGYIRKAGFCVAATAEREGRRIICVVMGMASSNPRFQMAKQLLEDAFAQGRHVTPVRAGEHSGETLPVPGADGGRICPVPLDDLSFHVPSGDCDRLAVIHEYRDNISAPLNAGDVVGSVRVELDGVVLGTTPLIVPEDVGALRWWLVLSDGHARWEGLDKKTAIR